MRAAVVALLLQLACSAPGPQGPAGSEGPAGARGSPGPVGAMGDAGVAAAPPQLLAATLPVGDATCALGGVRVFTDGGSVWVCNAAAPDGRLAALQPLAPGAECPEGGVRVVTSAGSYVVCDGARGPAALPLVTALDAGALRCTELSSDAGRAVVCDGPRGSAGVLPQVSGAASCGPNGGVTLTLGGAAAAVCTGATGQTDHLVRLADGGWAPVAAAVATVRGPDALQAVAGTRLAPLYDVGPDGSRSAVHGRFWDTLRNEPCVPQPAFDGGLRCLPERTGRNATSYRTYRDSSCTTTPVAIFFPGVCAPNPPPLAFRVEACTDALRVYQLGAEVPSLTGAPCSCGSGGYCAYGVRNDDGTCRVACFNPGTRGFLLGPELPLSSFELVTEDTP